MPACVCGHRLLAFFGRYSYALYVFHYQIYLELERRIDIGTIGGSDTPARLGYGLLAGGLSVAAAWASWRLVESQALKLKRFFPYGGTFADGSGEHSARALLVPNTE